MTGVSARMASRRNWRAASAWPGRGCRSRGHPFSLEIIAPDRPSIYVNLGPHPPRLWPEDVDRAHEIWLRLSEQERFGSQLHHRDVVGVALRRLERDLDHGDRGRLLAEIESEMRRELD